MPVPENEQPDEATTATIMDYYRRQKGVAWKAKKAEPKTERPEEASVKSA
jgi:hypothetical protein